MKNTFSAISALIFSAALSLTLAAPTAQAASSCQEAIGVSPIRSEYASGEITALTDASIARTKERLDTVAKIPAAERTIENSLLEMEDAIADMADDMNSLVFLAYVSPNEALRAESSKAEEKFGQFAVSLGSRRDLYEAVKELKATDPDQQRLLQKTIEGFEQGGMNLPKEKLELVTQLRNELSTRETKFSSNNNEDQTTIEFTAEELAGLPADFFAKREKTVDGKFIVTTKNTDNLAVMENASNSETRRKMLLAYSNRGTPENSKLMQETIVLRAKLAKELGFETWFDYRMQDRMAKSRKTVEAFLGNLRSKLEAKNASDLAELLALKKELDPKATELNQWDITYYAYQLQKRKFALDPEKVREYFPAASAVKGMFEIYSRLLGLRFNEVKQTKVWFEGVKLYEIQDAGTGKAIGYFYADFNPRPGKYSHAAAFTLVQGRELPNGEYNLPVSAIVSNFTPPSGNKPSLMTHDEVETLFHEFGHIMHQTITRAPFASLSGTSVARDFVEAPSQMLENWVWSPEMLEIISGHYQDPSQKLPKDMLEKMLAARNFQVGYTYTRQLMLASYDLAIHTSDGAKDANQIYQELYRQIIKLEPISGGNFPRSFGHMMGGYDAGYYGYLWAKVYAEDMFSTFPENDLTNPERGAAYRKWILEKGNMIENLEILRQFLGREPSSDAFFKKMGI